MTDTYPPYQLSVSDFFLFVRRRSWFILLFGLIGAVGLIAALGISSRATFIDRESTLDTQVPSSQVAYVVEGFGALRQALSLVGVTEEASARLFFPASSDVLAEFENKRDYYDARKAAKFCKFESPTNNIQVLCRSGAASATEIQVLLQKAYNSLFEQRFEPIVALLTRERTNSSSHQTTEVVNLLAEPPLLTVRVHEVRVDEVSSSGVPEPSVPPISFTFQNAVILGVGGAFASSLMALLILFALAVKSQEVSSVETLRRCLPAAVPTFSLDTDGPDVVGLEIRRLTNGIDANDLVILALGSADPPDLLIEFSKVCCASGKVSMISGTVDEQIKTLIELSSPLVIIACIVGKSSVADLARINRAVELTSKRVVGVVGVLDS